MKNSLTMQEILDETIEWYSVPGRRSVDNVNQCMYLGNNGNMCAFARCTIDPKILIEHSTVGIKLKNDTDDRNGIKTNQGEVHFDTVLKEKYRGHPAIFWLQLQRLHDFENYWRDGGLTETGKDFVNERIKPLINALPNTRESI